MNNPEKTQAEKLASDFMAKLAVYAPSKSDPIDELHWKEAEDWLAQAINQATAELLEENKSLKFKLHLSEASNKVRSWPEWKQALYGPSDAMKSAMAEIDRLTEENEQFKEKIETIEADTHRKSFLGGYRQGEVDREGLREICRKVQKQVAALVSEFEKIREDLAKAPALGYVFQADARAQIAIAGVQATAEAYTAKIRQEAREAAIRECLNIVEAIPLPELCEYDEHYDHDAGQVWAINLVLKGIKALLPQAYTEGGV